MNLFICSAYSMVKNLALKSSTNGSDHQQKIVFISFKKNCFYCLSCIYIFISFYILMLMLCGIYFSSEILFYLNSYLCLFSSHGHEYTAEKCHDGVQPAAQY